MLFQLSSIAGKGTVVYLLKFPENPPHYFAFKQSWVNSHWPNDVQIHQIIECAEIAPFKTKENECLFGEADMLEIFRYCILVLALDAAA